MCSAMFPASTKAFPFWSRCARAGMKPPASFRRSRPAPSQTGGHSVLPESDNWTAWLDILAGMEADLAEFDRGLTFSGVLSIVPEWKIPQNVGPIPENLVDRADRTLRAQRD